MYKHKLKKDIRCPLDYGLSMIGGKWKARILCLLGENPEPMRYSVLLKTLGNITDAVLSDTLKQLTKDGLIKRIQYEEIPPRVEYTLTPWGFSSLPVLVHIAKWAGASYKEFERTEFDRCMHCDYDETKPANPEEEP